jgi:hypothetical protein
MQTLTEHANGNSRLPSRFLVGAFVAVAMLLLGTLTAFAADMIKVQGESMTLATGNSVVPDSSAEPTGAGKAIRYTANATARKNVTYTKGATQIVVRARKDGTNANHPLLKVFTKTGTQSPVLRGTVTVSSTSYQEYTFPFSANSGTHQVQVRGANIASGRLLRVDYFRIPEDAPTVDTTPPETTIDSGPSGSVSGTTATFKFTSSEQNSAFQCQLLGREPAPPTGCTSPMSYSGLTAGTQYTFSVWATDASGNTDATPATRTFTPSGNDPYANPDSTSQTFGQGWTPAANSVHLNPRVTCSTDLTPANSGTGQGGVNIVNPNVVLINPQIKGCSVGILVKAGGFKLLADQNKVGYGSAASPALRNNFRAVRFDKGSFGYEISGLNGGELFMRDNYRSIQLTAGHDCLIADTDIDHPLPLDWDATARASGPRHALNGIKVLPDYASLPVADRSFHDCVIRSNDVAGYDEEGISLDGNAGGPSGGIDTASTIQGTSPLAAVDATTNTVTLAQPPGGQWTGLENAKGAWLSFNQGGAVGRYLQIDTVDAVSRRLTLLDPNDYLSRAAAGDQVSVTSPFRNITISDNVINAEGSRTGIDFHGPVYSSRMANNIIKGKPSYSYPLSANLRTADGLSVPQSARVTTLADGEAGAMTPRPHVGVASYNSVVGNIVDWDLSFNVAMSTAYRGIPVYHSGNTSTNGVAVWSDRPDNNGSYFFLTIDPNT